MTSLKFTETDIIGCKFPQVTERNGEILVDEVSKEYFYKLLPGQKKPNVGDFVVVSCARGFRVCVVTTINASSEYKDLAYVVGVVDVDLYRTELRRKALREHLHEQLMQKKKELESTIFWDLLAEKNPEFRELLEAYRSV